MIDAKSKTINPFLQRTRKLGLGRHGVRSEAKAGVDGSRQRRDSGVVQQNATLTMTIRQKKLAWPLRQNPCLAGTSGQQLREGLLLWERRLSQRQAGAD